jgi:hypothetical protein
MQNMARMQRRSFVASLAATAAAQTGHGTSSKFPPIRQITKGPRFHWFGYYHKWQFDASGRYVLGNEVAFEHRSPKADDEIRIGFVDLKDKDRWTDVGSTKAWNWQQGCMLQFLPGSKSSFIYNNREQGHFVSHIVDLKSGKRRTIPAPIYALSPDGTKGIYPDFRRLNDCRPGYGYAGITDPNRDQKIPDDAGLWQVDLETGKSSLLISFAQAAAVAYPKGFPAGAKHWFNHLLYNTDGTRFLWLHRWRGDGEAPTGFSTRMFTANADGSQPFVLDPWGKTSHFVWRDPNTVIAWAYHPSHGNAFYHYFDKTDRVEVIGKKEMPVNGHVTYLPGNRWILNDCYPDGNRNQNPYLFELASSRRVELGSFFAPPDYAGEWRCDLHPRFSRDGRQICIDSAHVGGRQMYLIDIAGLI